MPSIAADHPANATLQQGARTQRADAKPVVVAQRLTKVFRDFWLRARARAVDSIDFHIDRGEIFGLLGPNGSGKSTTIKMMLGLLKPTSGRVSVFGQLPTDVATKKRIGYLPEESYLYQFLNARETLDYYGRLFEIERRVRTKRVDELLEMVGLTGAQFRPVREYSKGMQRRIGIAQALINDPDFLVLDEPTTGLDPIGTRQVKDLILQLGKRGKTVLLSSHLLSDVEDVVDRMVILYGGRIRAAGTCDELLEAHHRTTIETDALDESLVAQIDALIRARTGSQSAVIRVSKPRQRLEDLFLDIVERARQERLETSGATHDGQTAEFLRAAAEDNATGQGLLDRLTRAADEPSSAPPEPGNQAPAGPSPADQSRAVLDKLMAPTPSATAAPAPAPAHPTTSSQPLQQPSSVDRSMIDSLLGKPMARPGEGDASKPPEAAP